MFWTYSFTEVLHNITCTILLTHWSTSLSHEIKKTTQIISAINSYFDEEEGTTSPSPVACRSRSHSFAPLNLNLPSVKDAPTDDGDRPFTFEELKSSLQF
jgi:hypothetical protein